MIKAIETVYNGYRFRSRLEARWAVFFDTLHIPYAYEREGYDLDGTWYLPDFWLPEQDCWVEVKGKEPTPQEFYKGSYLATLTGKNVYIFPGEIPLPHDMGKYDGPYLCGGDWNPETKYDENGDLASEVKESLRRVISYSDCSQWWCECPNCGILGICYSGRSERLPCNCFEELSEGEKYWINYATPRLTVAYTVARQARF